MRGKGSSSTLIAWAALCTSIVAMAMSLTGLGAAKSQRTGHLGRIVRLGPDGRIPANLLPTVPRAVEANRLGSRAVAQLRPVCPVGTADLGTWCLGTKPNVLNGVDIGRGDYLFASQTCVAQGGYLPSATQLVGAANRVSLESVITDSPQTAIVAQDPTVGLKDHREMSATLVTTAAGSDAAGSEGVSVGSTGNPHLGEPNPIPTPAVPEPGTLQYVTVYDNFNKGGFAGSEPVSTPENFRCAFNKVPPPRPQGG
jgi:hypothetical protein